MINLLPTDYRQSLLYARRNTSLRSWLVILTVVWLGVLLIVGGGYLYLQNEINLQSKKLEAASQNLKVQDIDGTRKRLDGISANTKLILQVLEREILFSKLLRQLGSILPANTALQEIQIDELKGGLTLRASASDINAATQLQLNLQDPANKIFSKADIESISCASASQGQAYPCSVQIRALFASENPYTYISTTTTGEKKQ